MRFNILKAAGILLAATFFSSCMSGKVAGSLSPVYVTNTKKIELLNPSEMSGTIDSMQLLEGQFGENQFSLICYFIADESQISISLLNDFGTSMGELVYDGETVDFNSAIFPQKLKAEYIVADIQNAFYKKGSLKDNFAAAGLGFEVEENDGTETRTITSKGKIIEKIEKKDKTVTITNILRGYKYILTDGNDE